MYITYKIQYHVEKEEDLPLIPEDIASVLNEGREMALSNFIEKDLEVISTGTEHKGAVLEILLASDEYVKRQQK